MTLEQQIQEIARAASQQVAGQVQERLLAFATEVSQAATADRVSVVRELRLAAEAEVAKRSQEAVAAAQAEHSRRLDEAVSAAQQEGNRRADEAVASARAEQSQRITEAVAAARVDMQRERDAAVGQLRADLSREHELALEAMRNSLTPQIEAALVSARSEHAHTLADTLSRSRVDADQRVAQAVEGAVRDVAAELERVRREATDELDRVRREGSIELERVRREGLDEVERVRRVGADALVHARREAADELETARRQTRDAVDAVRQDLAGELDSVRHASVTTERALVEARAAERQNELAQVARLTDAIRRIDAAKSLTDVLDALAESCGREAPRVAVFVLRGARLTGWRHSGFPAGVDPAKLELPVEQPGLLSRALRAARAVSTSEGAPGDVAFATPFGVLSDDNAGLAVPVRIGGETVAVVYADDAVPGHTVPSPFPEAVEVLACHAARCLEVLTYARAAAQAAAPPRPMRAAPAAPASAVSQAGPATAVFAPAPIPGSQPPLVATVPDVPPTPRYAAQTRSFQPSGDEDEDAARRYARLLVSEIKLYHEAAVAEGRRNRNLLERLRAEIERAQHLYEERVPVQVRLKSDFFGQELVRTLAGGDPTLLGAR